MFVYVGVVKVLPGALTVSFQHRLLAVVWWAKQLVEHPNPYESSEPEPMQDRIGPNRLAFLWPRTSGRCFLLALFAWPLTMFVTDVLGIYIEPAAGVDDFGLAVLDFSIPVVWSFAIVLWFRAYLVRNRSADSFLLALFTLPGWFVFTVVVTFLNFPFGRIDPNF